MTINKRTLPNKLVPPGKKNPKINKPTGTFIWHYRVSKFLSFLPWIEVVLDSARQTWANFK